MSGGTFPIVRVMRFEGRWAAVVRLPSGATRMVYVSQPGNPPRAPDSPQHPPDLQEMWKRREWLRALIARSKDAGNNRDTPMLQGQK